MISPSHPSPPSVGPISTPSIPSPIATLTSPIGSSTVTPTAAGVLASPLAAVSNIKPLAGHTATPLAKTSTLEKLQKLFDNTIHPQEKALLKTEISGPADPLLEQIISDEAFLMDCGTQGQFDDTNVQNLLSKQYNIKQVTVPLSSGSEKFVIFEDQSDHKRLVMDQSVFKIKTAVLPGLAKPKPQEWKDWTTNLKTCTSILSNQDASFCGDNGVMVYLAPNKDAMINAAAHDVLSPSESWFGSAVYDSARATVQAYVEDQEKLKMGANFVHGLVTQLEKKLPSALKSTLQPELSQLDQSSFDKRYYTEDPISTKMERQLNFLVRVLTNLPDMEKELGTTTVELAKLNRTISDFLKDTAVLNRGTQRAETTGWDLTKVATATNSEHPLHPIARGRDQEIRTLHRELMAGGVLKEALPGEGETMETMEMRDFLVNKRDTLFNNIFLNVMENYTATKAMDLMKTKQGNENYLKILKELEKTGIHSSFQPKVNQLKLHLKEDIEASKKLYTEIQMHSEHLKVSGLGIKAKTLNFIDHSKSLPELQTAYQKYKTNLENKAIPDADKKIRNDLILSGLNAQLQARGEIPMKSFDELENIVITLEVMVEAKKKNFPLFVHRGR